MESISRLTYEVFSVDDILFVFRNIGSIHKSIDPGAFEFHSIKDMGVIDAVDPARDGISLCTYDQVQVLGVCISNQQ